MIGGQRDGLGVRGRDLDLDLVKGYGALGRAIASNGLETAAVVVDGRIGDVAVRSAVGWTGDGPELRRFYLVEDLAVLALAELIAPVLDRRRLLLLEGHL